MNLQATKSLSMSEDYLRDHFPCFPIMPGVLMLEAMYQTAAWLVRATEDFASSLVLLKEANNVKYSDFVQPGETLRVTAELVKGDGNTYSLNADGEMGDTVAVRGRLVLVTQQTQHESTTSACCGPQTSVGSPAVTGDSTVSNRVDAHIVHSLRNKFRLLYHPASARLQADAESA